MKSIIIFYDDKNSKYKDEKIFNGKSSVELTKELFLNNDFSKNLQKIQESDIFTIKNCQNLLELFTQMNEITEKSKADFVIFSYNFVKNSFLSIIIVSVYLVSVEVYCKFCAKLSCVIRKIVVLIVGMENNRKWKRWEIVG